MSSRGSVSQEMFTTLTSQSTSQTQTEGVITLPACLSDLPLRQSGRERTTACLSDKHGFRQTTGRRIRGRHLCPRTLYDRGCVCPCVNQYRKAVLYRSKRFYVLLRLCVCAFCKSCCSIHQVHNTVTSTSRMMHGIEQVWSIGA